MFNSVSKKIPNFDKMSDKQKTAVMSLTYNAGEGWYGTGQGSWPSLTKSIASGDWVGALNNWKGSDAILEKRRAEERALFAQGPKSPKDAKKVSQPKSSNAQQQNSNSPNIFQRVLDPIRNIFQSPTRGSFGMEGGGSLSPVTTTTGIDIPGGTSGADTQYLPQYNTAVQPGEEIFKYVIPKDAAQKGMGARLLQLTNQMVANFDSNSTAAKIGFRNRDINIRPPLNRMNGGGNMVLPPITSSSSGGLKGSPVASSQDLYAFSPVLETSIEVRKMHVDMYGILD